MNRDNPRSGSRKWLKLFRSDKTTAEAKQLALAKLGIVCEFESCGDEFGYGETFAVYIQRKDKAKYFMGGGYFA